MTFTPPRLLDGNRWANLRVGLLGGSFNPPHAGHVHISLIALAALRLDFVWWLVSPHNPLKDKNALLPFDERMALCRNLTPHPRLLVSDLEQRLGVNRSYDTVVRLRQAFPQTSFAWLTGMDNALSFHHWYRWRDILGQMATAHIARPPAASLITAAPLRLLAGQHQAFPQGSAPVPLEPHRTYWLLNRTQNGLSSTALRQSLPGFAHLNEAG